MRRADIAECDGNRLFLTSSADYRVYGRSRDAQRIITTSAYICNDIVDIFRARLNTGEWMSLIENDSATILRECSLQIAMLHDMRRVDLHQPA